MTSSRSTKTPTALRRRRAGAGALLITALSSSIIIPSASAQSTGSGSCTDVHIFLSRGNNEPYPGRQGSLVEAICSRLSEGDESTTTCDYEDVVFDNALETEYCGAVEAGRVAAVDQVTAYNEKCPDTKLVVSGYSQGAQAVGDMLAGGGGTFFQGCVQPESEGLDRGVRPGNMIKAFLMFGNTRHTAGQPYNVLEGSQFDGIFPRTGGMLEAMAEYSDVVQDYCQEGDPICTGDNGDVTANHLNYFQIFPPQAAEWVWEMVGGNDDEPTSSSSSSSSTVSSTTSTKTSSTTTATTTTSSTNPPTTTKSSSSSSSSSSSGMITSTVTKTSTSTTITGTGSTTTTTSPPTPTPSPGNSSDDDDDSSSGSGSGSEPTDSSGDDEGAAPRTTIAGGFDKMLMGLAVVGAWFVILA